MDILYGLAVGLLAAYAGISLYRQGVRDGRAQVMGEAPAPMVTPADLIERVNPVNIVQDFRDSKDAREYDEKIAEGWNNIFGYQGDEQFEGGEA